MTGVKDQDRGRHLTIKMQAHLGGYLSLQADGTLDKWREARHGLDGMTKGCAPSWTIAEEPLWSDPVYTKWPDELEGSHA